MHTKTHVRPLPLRVWRPERCRGDMAVRSLPVRLAFRNVRGCDVAKGGPVCISFCFPKSSIWLAMAASLCSIKCTHNGTGAWRYGGPTRDV
jgi:hypothetical protein